MDSELGELILVDKKTRTELKRQKKCRGFREKSRMSIFLAQT